MPDIPHLPMLRLMQIRRSMRCGEDWDTIDELDHCLLVLRLLWAIASIRVDCLKTRSSWRRRLTVSDGIQLVSTVGVPPDTLAYWIRSYLFDGLWCTNTDSKSLLVVGNEFMADPFRWMAMYTGFSHVCLLYMPHKQHHLRSKPSGRLHRSSLQHYRSMESGKV